MNWWKILKNAKVSGKTTGKGSSFDASKIKINIDKDSCKQKLLQYIKNSKQIKINSGDKSTSPFISEDVGEIENKEDWKNLTEKQACEMIMLIDENWVIENDTVLGLFKDFNFEALVNKPNILDIKVGQYTFRRFIRGSSLGRRRTKKLYISYGFSLTENMRGDRILPSTWGIMGTIDSVNWPLPNFDWRK